MTGLPPGLRRDIVGMDFDAALFAEDARDLLAQQRDSGARAIAVIAVGDGAGGRLDNGRGRRQIDIAQMKRKNALAFGAPLRGHIRDGESGLRAEILQAIG